MTSNANARKLRSIADLIRRDVKRGLELIQSADTLEEIAKDIEDENAAKAPPEFRTGERR